MYLSKENFQTVIASTPLISIDLIIKNSQGEYLLGYRNNKPAQDYWFVPGGRILKDESKSDAYTRLVQMSYPQPQIKLQLDVMFLFSIYVYR